MGCVSSLVEQEGAIHSGIVLEDSLYSPQHQPMVTGLDDLVSGAGGRQRAIQQLRPSAGGECDLRGRKAAFHPREMIRQVALARVQEIDAESGKR